VEGVPPSDPMPVTPEDFSALTWGGLDIDSKDIDLLTCVHIRRSNWHKASHMATCKKSAKAKKPPHLCRARLPGDVTHESVIEVKHPGCVHVRAEIAAMELPELALLDWALEDVCGTCGAQPLVSFALRRTPCSVWMPQCSPVLSKVFGCNNNIQYVYNQLLGFYVGMYASKGCKENA
jgi:hypothetical protein